MSVIKLILEVYATAQVADDKWRDATSYAYVDVEVPDAVAEMLAGAPGSSKARVVGSAQYISAPAEPAPFRAA